MSSPRALPEAVIPARARLTRRCRWPALLLLAAACAPDPATPSTKTPPRAGRFGSLRDFVLLERVVDGATRMFFVDRFEVTRADWREFAATAAGRAVDAGAAAISGDSALPVGAVDLVQARAFARWRFARLPRLEEWAAASGDERNRFPWGSKEDPTRANTGELGLGEPTPVGTFEAGRRAGGGQPYDLVGNVSEWTESVSTNWSAEGGEERLGQLDPGASLMEGRSRALRSPALAVWQGPGGIVPLVFAVAAGGDRVPRDVVGADFLTTMSAPPDQVLAGDRRMRTGLRLYAEPREVLLALLGEGVAPSAEDVEQVRRFVRRGSHRAALAAAWDTIDAESLRARPLFPVLAEELAR